jgi:hypothetical protein
MIHDVAAPAEYTTWLATWYSSAHNHDQGLRSALCRGK